MQLIEGHAPSGRKPSWYGLTAFTVAFIDWLFALSCLGITMVLTGSVEILHLERRELSFIQNPRLHDLINIFNGSSLFCLTFWIGILLQLAITIANALAAQVVYKMSKVYPTGPYSVSLWERSKVTKVFMWFYQVFILSCDVIEVTAFILFFKGLWGVEAFMPVALHFFLILWRCVAFLPFNMAVLQKQPVNAQPF